MPQNKLNFLQCYTDYGNTGHSDCDIEPAFPKGDLLIPRGETFTEAETATPTAFAAAIAAGLLLDNKNSRYYWIGDYDGVTATGEAPVIETFNSGRKRKVREGTVGEDLLITALSGGINLHREQYKFNGKHREFDAIRFDINGIAWGRTVTTEAGATTFGGKQLSRLEVGNFMATDGSKGGQWTVSVEYKDASEVNNSFGYMDLGDIDPFAAGTGLISVNLAATSPTAVTIHVTARTNYGADLHDLFATEAAVTGAWSVTNAKPGSADYGDAITITGVASTATGWTITIAATGVDTDNPGTGEKVKVTMTAPSVLNGLNIVNVESNSVIVTLGA